MAATAPLEIASSTIKKPPARTRERKPRGRGLRTRTGCITCRKRHLKCNELKPICGPCERSGHSCFYADHSAPIPGSNSASTASAPTATSGSNPDSFQRAASASSQVPGNSSRNESLEPFDGPGVSHRHHDPLEFDRTHRHPPVSWTPVTDDGSVVSSLKPSQWTAFPGAIDVSPSSVIWTAVGEDQYTSQQRTAPPSVHSDVISLSGHHLQPAMPRNVTSHAIYGHASPEDLTVTSQSTSGTNVDAAIARWFGLLANDAELEHTVPFHGADENHRPPNGLRSPEPYDFPRTRNMFNVNSSYSSPSVVSIGLETPKPENLYIRHHGPKDSERQLWQTPEPLSLQPHEVGVFDMFVNKISHWVDIFDPMKQFSTHIPHLAMHNVGLLNAILALSVRHMSLNTSERAEPTHHRSDSVQYYYEALHYVQKAMQYESYNTSVELLATCLIISAYEMLDGSRKDWERHLQGVFWIQKSQAIHGESEGLKQAVWWAWLCQDVWAAYREKRKPYNFWKPNRRYSEMNCYELAARSVYLFSQVVAYCPQEEIERGGSDIQLRIDQADSLTAMLDEWRQHLTVEFSPLPSRCDASDVFKPIWINPPPFSLAVQVHAAARILLAFHRPCVGGYGDFMHQRASVATHVETICGLAMTMDDFSSSIMSSQCIFIAGMCIRDVRQREMVLKLLDKCHTRTGWPIHPLSDDLQMIWNTHTPHILT